MAWAATAAQAGAAQLNAVQRVCEEHLRLDVSEDGDDHVHDDGCQRKLTRGPVG